MIFFPPTTYADVVRSEDKNEFIFAFSLSCAKVVVLYCIRTHVGRTGTAFSAVPAP